MGVLHSSLFDHSADVVEVVSKSTHRQTQHLDLRLCPFCSEDEDREGQRAARTPAASLVSVSVDGSTRHWNLYSVDLSDVTLANR